MKIVFLHGWQSVPGGVKPTYLKVNGHEVINPKLPDEDFEEAVRIAQTEIDKHQPQVIVGSSRGGAVAMSINSGDAKVVLICPAWKKFGTTRTAKPDTVILHSRADEVIPFTDTEELVKTSGLAISALVEIGTDHRMASKEPLEAMLTACELFADKIVGCDFGVPKRAGDQTKKNILIEATRIADKHYAIRPFGRNHRPLRWLSGPRDPRVWSSGRPGWTLPELVKSLAEFPVRTIAMDFPFGIPLSLLNDADFAAAVGHPGHFATRAAWVAFLSARLKFEFTSERANGEMEDLSNFDSWRTDSRFWKYRASDVATNGQPPLKHIGQNLFTMTIGGACLLDRLEGSGYDVVLGHFPGQLGKTVFETYPSFVAARIGFTSSYKSLPVACLNAAVRFLEKRGIRLDFDPDVKRFCETYRTGSKKDDPDGADAFLCLVAAICFNEGNREIMRGNAADAQLEEEGGIIVPVATA